MGDRCVLDACDCNSPPTGLVLRAQVWLLVCYVKYVGTKCSPATADARGWREWRSARRTARRVGGPGTGFLSFVL